MESIHRLTHRVFPKPFTREFLKAYPISPLLFHTTVRLNHADKPVFRPGNPHTNRLMCSNLTLIRSHRSSAATARAGWFLGMRDKKQNLPDIVKAGDPVLHEPAREVEPDEIGSERIQKIIHDMVKVMRTAPGVGLAAPQIGIPLKELENLEWGVKLKNGILYFLHCDSIVVLEDTKEYISYAPKQETKVQDRRPFDLLVIINPKLVKKGNKTALFFEGCLSVDGFRAVVERHLDVEVTGLDQTGQLIKVNASGWQARILQHECDHLEGTLYVDKMVPRTFRTVQNLDLPLFVGCPELGVR